MNAPIFRMSRLAVACMCMAVGLRAQQIVQAEYFFDTDLGVGQNQPLSVVAGDTVMFSSAIPLTGLTRGYHYLYVRTMTEGGQWSTSLVKRLYVYNHMIGQSLTAAPIVAAEYHLLGDLGPDNGTTIPIQPGDTVTVSDTITIPDDLFGPIPLLVRVKDANGIWSEGVDTMLVKGSAVLLSAHQRPVMRASIPQPFEIVLTNPGTVPVYDVALILDLPTEGAFKLPQAAAPVAGVSTDSFPPLTLFNGRYLTTLWYDSIPPSGAIVQPFLYTMPDDLPPHGAAPVDFRYQVFYEQPRAGESPRSAVPAQTSIYQLARACHYSLAEADGVRFDLTNSEFSDSTIAFLNTHRAELDSLSYTAIVGALLHHVYGVSPQDTAVPFISTIIADALYGENEDDPLSLQLTGRSSDNATKPCTRTAWQNCANEDPHPCPECEATINDTPCLQPPQFSAPVDFGYKYSSTYCERRCNKKNPHRNHHGMDIVMTSPDADWSAEKKLARASFTGTLKLIQKDEKKGGGIIVELSCADDPTIKVVYMHLNYVTTTGGVAIDLGPLSVGHEFGTYQKDQPIGAIGNTGMPLNGHEEPGKGNQIHLHFEVILGSDTCDPTRITGMNPDESSSYSSSAFHGECRWCDSDKGGSFACEHGKKIKSDDPNLKLGPEGYSIGNWTGVDSAYAYTVAFENVDSAAASAQAVIIRDTLDVASLSPTSFRANVVSLGLSFFTMPEDFVQNYADTIDTRSWNQLLTAMSFSFDTLSGATTWTFYGLDPVTLQPISEVDPVLGILPPDTMPPLGSGMIGYSMKLRDDVAHGTTVLNQAHIIFDGNAAMATEQWINTVDRHAPASWVDVLPAVTTDTLFTVSWTGTDSLQSGIEYYDLYYAVDQDTLFQPWLQVTSDTSTQFDGEYNHTYYFYSVAVDSVGNREDEPLHFDAYTMVTFSTPVGSYTGDDMRLSLFPNPTTGSVTLHGRTTTGCELVLVVRNALGQVLEQRALNVGPGVIDQQIDLSRLAPGTYFAAITCNNAKLLERLIRIGE